MSDSFRHTPIVGNTMSKSEKKDKRFANRSWRCIVKACIRAGKFDALPAQREVSNIWSFNKDGKHWIGNRHPELMRK